MTLALLTAAVLVPFTDVTHAAVPEQTHNKRVICKVFGPRYCAQAVRVAWCESRWLASARNGQYLGLFQMGSNERRLFGHGPSVREQAEAARRYFVASGRDWSPWTCRWAAFKERELYQ